MVSSHSASYLLCLFKAAYFYATKSTLMSDKSLAISESGAEFLIYRAIVSSNFLPKEVS